MASADGVQRDGSTGAARSRGLAAVALTTFAHVIWNGPFYARYGFVKMTPPAAWLAALLAAETGRACPTASPCGSHFSNRPLGTFKKPRGAGLQARLGLSFSAISISQRRCGRARSNSPSVSYS